MVIRWTIPHAASRWHPSWCMVHVCVSVSGRELLIVTYLSARCMPSSNSCSRSYRPVGSRFSARERAFNFFMDTLSWSVIENFKLSYNWWKSEIILFQRKVSYYVSISLMELLESMEDKLGLPVLEWISMGEWIFNLVFFYFLHCMEFNFKISYVIVGNYFTRLAVLTNNPLFTLI